ncbi:unnamed protein product, partial [Bubo scandiacus]
CLASLPSNSKTPPPLSQRRSSQEKICLPVRWLKSFRISHNSLRDRDQMITSGSFSCSRVGLAHLHPLQCELT